jgi:hypothetical protein
MGRLQSGKQEKEGRSGVTRSPVHANLCAGGGDIYFVTWGGIHVLTEIERQAFGCRVIKQTRLGRQTHLPLQRNLPK